ncbi:MAG: DUF1501 domain-containing protein [Planctomycetaceae bacterium]
MDLSSEPEHILKMYGAEPGKSSFANNCLLARRLVEKGVLCAAVSRSLGPARKPCEGSAENCADTDQACVALIQDLKQRGMLDDTLVIWGGEFGRTPMVQGGSDGRDHHPNCFSYWLAGGGIKGGITYGASDDFGFNVTDDQVHVRDLHATILYLLGLDHERLTHRVQGLDMRLTGVLPSRVVGEILA